MVSQQFCLMPQYCFSNGVNFANAADGTRMVVASYPGSPSARPSRSCHQQPTATHPRVCKPRVAPLLDAFAVVFVVAAVANVASRGAAERRQQGPCISMEHSMQPRAGGGRCCRRAGARRRRCRRWQLGSTRGRRLGCCPTRKSGEAKRGWLCGRRLHDSGLLIGRGILDGVDGSSLP